MIGHACRLNLPDNDGVIASRINVHNAAFDIGESPLQERGSAGTLAVAGAFKPILVLGSKPSRNVLLVLSEYVYSEGTTFNE